MNEDPSEILDYLPYSFRVPQEQEYIAFLWDSFQSNYENRKYQFALIPFHMLFMSAVYFDIWKIKINNQNDFEKALIGLRKDDEKAMLKASWPFTFHKINESQILRFLKLLDCDDDKIGVYAKIVDDRNSVAHSNGNIYVQAQESLDVKIKEIIRSIREITEHSKCLINEIFQNFIIQNWNSAEREYLEDKEQIHQLLIQKNYFSRKDIEFCLSYDIDWQKLPEILEEFKNEIKQDEKIISPETLKLIQQYPEAANEILKGFDTVFHGNIEVEDFPIVQNVIKTASMLLTNQTKYMTESKIELFKRLSKEKSPEGIKNLTRLLEKHDLPQLTSVASIIMDRLQRIKYLKATIEEETAYELTGEDSVHNQLAKSLWMIDDSYWLLYSNKTLATFLNKDCKSASEDEKKRPDLICATDNDRLVIVELKRPSHKIEQKDIQQLQNYLITADQFRSPPFCNKAGFLIGKEITPHDQKFVDQIPSLKFKPYVQLVEECERRYQEYLKAIEKHSV